METPRPLLRMPVTEAFAEIRRRISAAVGALVTPSRPFCPAPTPRPVRPVTRSAPQAPRPAAPRPAVPDSFQKFREYFRRTCELLRRHGLDAVAQEWAREIAPIQDVTARTQAVQRLPAVRRAMSQWTPPTDPHVLFALEYCAQCDVAPEALYLDAVSLAQRAAFLQEADRRRYCRVFSRLATGEDPELDEESDPLGEMLRQYDRNHPVPA